MKSFYQFLEGLTAGDFLSWGRDQQNKFYEKGVRDAMEDDYNPPSWGSPMSASNREQYMHGWRSMGKRIPPGRTNSNSPLSDREWFRKRLRQRRYGAANPGPINIIAADNPEWDDPDFDVEQG